jgi:hypothetical protein
MFGRYLTERSVLLIRNECLVLLRPATAQTLEISAVGKYMEQHEQRERALDNNLDHRDEGDVHRLVSSAFLSEIPWPGFLNKCDKPTSKKTCRG